MAYWRKHIYKLIASEISKISRYSDSLYQWRPRPDDKQILLELIDCENKSTIQSDNFPNIVEEQDSKRSLVLLNGNLNYSTDIQSLFSHLHGKLSRHDRVVAVVYNSYFSFLYKWMSLVGLRTAPVPTTFLTVNTLKHLAILSDFELVRRRGAVFFPISLFGIGKLLDVLVSGIPIIRKFSAVEIITLRPIQNTSHNPLLSIVIPARNERGNIEPAIQRLKPLFKRNFQIIFVEGHSKDGTWEEILRVQDKYKSEIKIEVAQQSGRGKVDAVRLGFSMSTGEILTILDADLTMPPEMLPRFYDALLVGHGDFINGSRLVYPMESEAMRFLNLLGNVFFTKALSICLGQALTDTLCGTKMMWRHDYLRMVRWREDFGDFDPFGDYELIFPAAVLALGVVDIPIRYRDRTYGSTNINRFRHGLILLKMTLIGFRRIFLSQQT